MCVLLVRVPRWGTGSCPRGSVCRQCANCPVVLIARVLNGDTTFFLFSLCTGKSDMALWNKMCPMPL